MISLTLTCTCGVSRTFEGSRRWERIAKAEWADGHTGCTTADNAVPPAAPTFEPEPEPVDELPPPNGLEGTFVTSHGEEIEVRRDPISGDFVTKEEFEAAHPPDSIERMKPFPVRRKREVS